MTNLAVRARTEEQMDSPDLDPATYLQILADLSRVNRWTLAARPTLAFLRACMDDAELIDFIRYMEANAARGWLINDLHRKQLAYRSYPLPYGWRAEETPCGLFRIGDQGAVISSLAGDGVAIALTSGIEAASEFLRDGPAGAGAFQAALARKARFPLKTADLLRYSVERGSLRPAVMCLASIRGLASLAARLTRIA